MRADVGTGGAGGRRLLSRLAAAATVTRLRATVGYNLAYVALGAGLGLLGSADPGAALRDAAAPVAGYALATFLAKGSASVADAVHDRPVDAENPSTERVAAAVGRLGVEPCWSLFVLELVAGVAVAGRVALAVGAAWPLAAVSATALLGFAYSYPPRLKERGLLNHVVTTGVDVCAVVLATALLVADALTVAAVVAGGVVFAYTFGYHLVHQAADAHYDRGAGVETFATRAGVPRTLALAAGCSGAAAGLALALGYVVVAVASLLAAAWYLRLYGRTRGRPPKARTDVVADRFDVGRVATALNAATALAVWVRVLGFPSAV
ncbi:UbiA family prenyltransferase [Halobaculum sp. EA56]|uniref:UbiA family prenyltransferase n=1 Tax=Halobaculum sp. EA56 TaxID=3421648 RepID=UPI003EBC74B7